MGEQNITCMDERVILGNGVRMCEHIFLGPDSQNLTLFPSLSLAVMETDLPNEFRPLPISLWCDQEHPRTLKSGSVTRERVKMEG